MLTESHQAQLGVENKLQEVQVHLNQANERAERFKKPPASNGRMSA